MELNHGNVKKIMLIITFTVLLFVGVQHFDVVLDTVGWAFAILSPFIMGGCIAFVLNVPLCLFENTIFRKGKTKNRFVNKIRRPISILLSIILVVSIVFTVIFLIIPELGTTFKSLIQTVQDFVPEVQNWVETKAAVLLEQYPEIEQYMSGVAIDWASLSTKLVNIVTGLFNGILSSSFSIITNIISGVTTFFIGFVFAVYVLANKEKLSEQGKKIFYSFLPQKRAERTIMVLQLSHRTFSNFLSGQCLEAVILGAMFYVTLSILRFPYALLIGVLIAFTALIPIFGAFVGSFIATFLIFMVDPMQAFWFLIIFNVLQQIEGNLIYPHVVGGSVGLPSIWVLFAVTVGGSLMGVMGMLIFIPLLSVIYTLLRENVKVRLLLRRIPSDKYTYTSNPNTIPDSEKLEKEEAKREERKLRLEKKNQKNETLSQEKKNVIYDGTKAAYQKEDARKEESGNKESFYELRQAEALKEKEMQGKKKSLVKNSNHSNIENQTKEYPNQKETQSTEKKHYKQLERISKDEK